MKKLYASILFLFACHALQAQYTIQIQYNASSGGLSSYTSGVYMHSGASDDPGALDGTALEYVVGNFVDDGIGKMQYAGPSLWSFNVILPDYYDQAPNGPVAGSAIYRIGLFFRDSVSSAIGTDYLGGLFFIDFSGSTPAVVNSDGTPSTEVTVSILTSVNHVDQKKNLHSYPNPLIQESTIQYQLLQSGITSINITDAIGNTVCNLLNEKQDAGKHEIKWNGCNNQGNKLSNGVYYYTVQNGSEKSTGKLVVQH